MYPVLIFLIAFIIVYIYSDRNITPIGVLAVFLITIIISSIFGCLYFSYHNKENFSNNNIHSPEDDNNSIWNKYDREENDEEGDIFEYLTGSTGPTTSTGSGSTGSNKQNTSTDSNKQNVSTGSNKQNTSTDSNKQNVSTVSNKQNVSTSSNKQSSSTSSKNNSFDLDKFNKDFERQFEMDDDDNKLQSGYNMLKPLMQEEVDFEQTNNRKKMNNAKNSNNHGLSNRLFDNGLNNNQGLSNRLFDNALNNNSIVEDPDNQNVNINVVYNINDELENKIKNIDRKLSLIGQADAEILRELQNIDEQNEGNYQQVNTNIGEQVESGGIPSTSWLRRLHPNFERAPETVRDINAITTRGRRTERNNASEVNNRFQERNQQNIMLSKIRNDNEKNNNKKQSDSSIYGFTYTDPKTWPVLNKSFNPNLLEKSSGVRPIAQGSYYKV